MANQGLHSAIGQLHQLLADRQGDQLTEQQLLQRFVATRDEAAFAALVSRHGPMVLAVCRSVLRHAQDAEDACQATFLVLARKASTVRKPHSLAPWLHGVAYRLAARVRAERGRTRDRRNTDRSPANPMDELTGRELHQTLHEELARLPESYRLPLILCYLEERTQDEAAKQLGWSVTTLKGRLDRGRALLRRRLTRRGLTVGLPLLVASLSDGAARGALGRRMGMQIAGTAVQVLAGGVIKGSGGRVAALAQGWERAVRSLKLKIGAALALAGAILGAGLTAYQVCQAERPEDHRQEDNWGARHEREPHALAGHWQPKADPSEGKGERNDERGDTLPEGALLRFGSARLRHGSVIRASTLSPDGKTLATAGDRSVIVWDLASGKILRRFPCDHGNTFCCPGLTFSAEGMRLAYVRSNTFACVWDLRTGKELQRFERCLEDGLGKLWNGDCKLTRQGKELLLISREAIETWDVESGHRTASVPVAETNALSPDGTIYLHNAENGAALGDARTGKELWWVEVVRNSNGLAVALAFSPDGKAVALVHNRKEIQVREVSGGKVLASFPLPESARLEIAAGGEGPWDYRIAFSTDGKGLLLGTGGRLIHRWNLAQGKELPPLRKHHCAVVGMHTLRDGRTLVSTGADGVIRRWDLRTGRHDPEPDSYEGGSCAAYSPDGRCAAVGDGRGRIDLWDGRTGKLVGTLQEEGAAVTHLSFAPDGKNLAAAERSGTVRLWQVPTGKVKAVWPHEPIEGEWFCNGIHFSPDGRLLCVSDYPRKTRVVEVVSGKLVWEGQSTYAEAFSPDGSTLLVAAPSGSYLTMLEAAAGKKRATFRLNTRIPEGLGVGYTLAFCPDGGRVAVAQGGFTLMLCDGRTCAETKRLTDGDLKAEYLKGMAEGKMKNQVWALAFSPDGKWLAAAGSDAMVYLWEATTGKEALRLSGHAGEVTSVGFSPDGRKLFSYGADGQGYLWDLKPGTTAGPRTTPDELWNDLSGTDAGKAYRAVWAFSDHPRGVSFLRRKLFPAVVPEKVRLTKLIADLDSDSVEVREAAARALTSLAELAAPAMEAACRTTSSLEQRKRLEKLLAVLKAGASPLQILQTRAVQALELSGNAEARQALQEYAGGAPAAHLTQESRAALMRLDRPAK